MSDLVLPRDDQRSVVIGATGSGKTVAAAWQLSKRSLDKMPWVIFDFKGDKLLNKIGAAEYNINNKPPSQPGLYIVHPLPNDIERVEKFLWACWQQEKIGLVFDEGYMITGNAAFRAILTQGRSKQIPCIVLTQRPKWIDRFVFSEADYYQVFRLNVRDDRQTVQEFVPVDIRKRLPEYHSYWYDVGKDTALVLKPVPQQEDLVKAFKQRIGPIRRAI